MDDGDVLLDLGPQLGLRFPWKWVVILGAGAVAACFAPAHDTWWWQMPLLLAGWAARTAWDGAVRPTRVTVHRDGAIVVRSRVRTRRFPARALISVERDKNSPLYTLEWGLDHQRVRVFDGSGRLPQTLAALNPDAALLEIRDPSVGRAA